LVENDIKRVIAYSTMSQLGYMMAANGASAFGVSIFHLFTHACFKALLFLAAGSVIMGMHHEQDMRKMGNLRKYMPITYVTFLVGSLSLSAIPPFAGFYSKDAIIEAVKLSAIPGATYAYVCLLIGAFVTALYSFRAVFMTFHTEERMDKHIRDKIVESPMVVVIPLLVLAIPSIVIGGILIQPVLSGGLFGSSVFVADAHNVVGHIAQHYPGVILAIFESFVHLPFWFGLAGVLTAWYLYIKEPHIPGIIATRLSLLYRILVWKYGFDKFNEVVIVRGSRILSDFFYYAADLKVIDNLIVNGTGRGATRLSRIFRRAQTGYLYHYAFVMILGLLGFLVLLLLG